MTRIPEYGSNKQKNKLETRTRGLETPDTEEPDNADREPRR